MGSFLAGAVKQGIRAIEWILRRAYRVSPLSDTPECILRVSPGTARGDLALSDGASVEKGDPLVKVHLWNERVGDLAGVITPTAWGAATLHRFRSSLQLLAMRVRDDPDWRKGVAVCGEASFVTDLEKARRLFNALGFDLVLIDRPGLRIWRPAFWDNLFATWLMWAFNPGSLRGKRMKDLTRLQIWMSRDRLLRRYLSPA